MSVSSSMAIGATALLEVAQLGTLLESLRGDGYTLVGPTLREGAIVYDELAGVNDLPAGIGDDHAPGRYRLRQRSDGALFGYVVGPHSYKREFLVPTLRLLRIRKGPDGPALEPHTPVTRKLALIGARGCELAALAVQDRVLAQGPYIDPDYAARRRDVFIVAVHCNEPGGTCFCASVSTGPRVTRGFDLALRELVEGEVHRFLVEAGTPAGAAVLERLSAPAASEPDLAQAQALDERAVARMGRALDTHDLPHLLYRNLDHPRWQDIATRCLACANCTLVCPTCFCTTTADTTSLTGDEAERVRHWDSCFTAEFSYVHGGSVRSSIAARYRQWLTHKLASWIDQFGSLGCVGCGRCITWCPVGIDLTVEVAEIRKHDTGRATATPEAGAKRGTS